MAVVSVLVLISVGAGLLSSVGEALFMGSPVYLVVPVLKAVLLLVLCAQMARGRRWSVVAMLVVQTLALVGFGFGLLLGLTPWFAASVTLSGLLTGVGVPVAVLWLCVGRLRAPRPPPAPPGPLPVPAGAGPPSPSGPPVARALGARPGAAVLAGAGRPPPSWSPVALPAGAGLPLPSGPPVAPGLAAGAWPRAAAPAGGALPSGWAPAATLALPTEELR